MSSPVKSSNAVYVDPAATVPKAEPSPNNLTLKVHASFEAMKTELEQKEIGKDGVFPLQRISTLRVTAPEWERIREGGAVAVQRENAFSLNEEEVVEVKAGKKGLAEATKGENP